jgi:hypothetical protein
VAQRLDLAHRCELFARGWLRHRPAPFRLPSNRPAATTDIAIAISTTAQSRAMIRWSLFMVAPHHDEFPMQRRLEDQISALIDAR